MEVAFLTTSLVTPLNLGLKAKLKFSYSLSSSLFSESILLIVKFSWLALNKFDSASEAFDCPQA